MSVHSLVIDDEFVALSKMVTMLEQFGPCDGATTAQQGLELFRNALKAGNPYRLVTIDINLPDADGLTLLKRFHAEERRNGDTIHARMLMVTAESSMSNVLAAVASKCDGFLVKPVRQSLLFEKLVALGFLFGNAAPQAAGAAEVPALAPNSPK